MNCTIRNPLGLLGLAFLLCACPGKTNDDTSDTQDTSDTEDTSISEFPAGDFTEEEVQFAASSAEMPNLIFLMSSLLITYGDETSCPSVVLDEATQTTTMTGGCTNDQGVTYSGEATLVPSETSLTTTYTQFGWTDDGTQIEVNAVAQMGQDQTVLTTGAIAIENLEDSLQLNLEYTDHSLSSAEQYIGSLFEQNGSYTVGGQVVVSNVDRFEIDLTAGNNETCETEMDTFELKLTGTRGEIAATSNPSDCDECLDWSTASASGQFCAEEETDTSAN